MSDVSLIELLARLRSLDIKLWAEGDRLRYNAPSGALTAELRETVIARKAEILAFLHQAATQSQAAPSPIQPTQRSGPQPLSSAQQRLWFLYQLEPENPVYNEPFAFRLAGRLNLSALERGLREIAQRHEILRTTFVAENGQPLQVIGDEVTLAPLSVTNLRSHTETERALEVRHLLTETTRQPFDLARGPLWRTLLLKLGSTEHILLIVMHHIICDGWSVEVLFRELATLYSACNTCQPAALPDLPIQYADFAIWQRQWLQNDTSPDNVLQTQLAYWKNQLRGDLPTLELPTDRPRPAVQTYKGATHTITRTPELTAQLKALSQREGVTLFTTLLATFAVLLYRYTGQEDVLIGFPVANRNRREIEDLIGFFVNTVVLRANLSGNPTFREVLKRMQATVLDADAHQDLPFERLVDELRPNRDTSRNPLFQVTFAPQTPFSVTSLGDLTLEPLHVETGSAKFDLTLFSADTASGVSETWEYNTDLFDADTITRMMGHYQTLLESITTDANQRIADLPLLTAEERQQILVTWNATRTAYPRNACLHTLFEQQVAQTPDVTALLFQGEEISYRDLNRRANQLAHALRGIGIGPDTIVGLYIERSVEMIVGILGILKAGGAYLPLDPAYPPERLSFMLQDTQAPVLLTQRHLLRRLPHHTARVLCLDTEWDGIAQNSGENNNPVTVSANLAYIIYTSGSTGRPKGVCVSHRNVVRLVKETNFAKLDADQTLLQLSTISFDAATLEIWGALLNGGRLVIYPPQRPSFDELAAILKEYQVTTLWLTAGLFHQMVEQHLEGLLAVRQLLAGGDVLSIPHVKQLLAQPWDGQLINGYGPTENTTFTSCYTISDESQIGTSIPIGRPVANTQVYILDQHLHPVPIGVPGELYSGGDGVARGYWDRPALTAEKFVPDPFSDEPGARLYRTGDLARYRPDGAIEFLGRVDYQVKIRGFRIELGEIEIALAEHPAVQEAIVLAREDTPTQKRLVAYVTLHPHKTLTISEMHNFLRNRLPDYMLPAALVQLDAMPLNANGKVDRHALPAPEFGRPELAQAFAAPRTPVEKRLVDIWREVLGIEKIGIHDNFFELGGDSILSIQIVAKANQAGLRLTPKQFFQYQTVAKLAAAADVAPVIQVEQEIVTGPVPLTPIQRWFFEQDLPNPHHWNQTMLFETRRPLDPTLLATAIQYLLEHHDALRLRFKRAGADWQQVNTAPDGNTPFVHVDLSAIPAGEQRVALEAHAAKLQASLDLGAGPLLRVTSFGLGSRRSGRLLIIIHHLAVDNVSWRILLEDLQTAYTQLSHGEKIELPPKTLAFKTWGERLADYAHTAQLQNELPYWLAQTEALPRTLLTESAKNLMANTEASARTLSVTLNVKETRALLQDVPSVYRTHINEVLLTALAQAYRAWTGTTTLRIDLEGHGREDILPDADLSRTVGWFTSIFPVRLDLSNTFAPGDALKSIKEQLRGIPNKGIGYGILRYLAEDSIRRELDARQSAEISFNYLGQFDRVLPEPSLFRLTREPYGPEHSPYGQRRYLLEIEGSVSGEQLWVNWTYSENLLRRSDIETLAHGFIEALRDIVAHCQTPNAGGYTPSDFPEAGLAQEELDALLAQLDEGIE